MFRMHLTNRSVAFILVVLFITGASHNEQEEGGTNHGEAANGDELVAVGRGEKPGRPTDVIADDWDVKSIKVRWKKPKYEGVTSIIGYDIQRLKEPYDAWAIIGSVNDEHTEFEVNDLNKDSKYQFRVIAKNEITPGGSEVRLGDPSDPAELTTVSSAFDIPSKPINLKILEYDPHHIDIIWDQPQYVAGGLITGYLVEYKTSIGNHWYRAIAIHGDQTTARINNFPFGSLEFRVSAENKIGFGEPSDVEAVTVRITYREPSRPLALTVAEKSNDYVVLKWEEPESDNGDPIRRYHISYKANSKGLWPTIGKISGDTTTAKVRHMDSGLVYSFRVIAVNRAGPGEASNVVDACLLPPQQTPADRPCKPLNVKIYDWGRYYVKLMWTKPVCDGGAPITQYMIECKKAGNDEWNPVTTVYDGSVTMATISDRKKFRCEFRVIAVNDFGLGDPSDATETITTKFSLIKGVQHKLLPLISKPGPPRDLELVALTRDTVSIKWTKPKDTTFGGPILGYVTEYEKENSYRWIIWEKIYGDVTSATIPNLRGGYYYYLRIRAVNKAGIGQPSNEMERVVAFEERPMKVPTVDNSLTERISNSPNRKTFAESEPSEETSSSDSMTLISPAQIATFLDRRYPPGSDRILYKLGELILIKRKDLASLSLFKGGFAAAGYSSSKLYDSIISGYLYALADEYRHFSYLDISYAQMIFGEYSEQYLEDYLFDHLIVEGKTHYVVPIHQPDHWIVMVVRLRLKQYAVLGRTTNDQATAIHRFTKFLLKKMRLPHADGMKRVNRSARPQSDGYNCGVFVCWYAKQFAVYQDLNEQRFSPDLFRVEIFNKITADEWKFSP